MAVGGGLLEDGRLQLEVLDDAAGPEVEVLADNVGELPARLLGGPVVHHGDGERLGDPDGVCHLRWKFRYVKANYVYAIYA